MSRLTEVKELAERGDVKGALEELNKIAKEHREKAKEEFRTKLPEATGYYLTDSKTLFMEVIIDGDKVAVCKGNVKDYESEIENRELLTYDEMFDRLREFSGYRRVDSYVTVEDAKKAYEERVKNRSESDKAGLLEPMYRNGVRVEFNEFKRDDISATFYAPDGTIIDYKGHLHPLNLRTLRAELFDDGYSVTPEAFDADPEPLDLEDFWEEDAPKKAKVVTKVAPVDEFDNFFDE